MQKTKSIKNSSGLDRQHFMNLSTKIHVWLFVIILVSAMAFRIYKAHTAGIVYDESFTWLHFNNDVYQSPTLDHPNFHVLTAIFNRFSHKLFGSYEHFVRIPSTLFSLIFSVSIAYIIFKTIKSNLLKLSLLLVVLFNPFTLNLSFLARGYAIALGGIYAQFAFIIWLINHKIKSRHRWIPIAIMVLTNFLVFGSMPSCVWVLFGTNATFALLYSRRVLDGDVGRLKATIINIVSIGVGTSISLFLLYFKNFANILHVRDEFGTKKSWAAFMKVILNDKLINAQSTLSNTMYWVFIGVLVIALLVLLYHFINALRKKVLLSKINLDDSGVFFVISVIVLFAGYYIQRHVLKTGLGFPRNGVVLIPLTLIAAAIIIDRCRQIIKTKFIASLICISAASALTLIAIGNPPSTHVVNVNNWDIQSAAGPLLKMLKAVNPEKVWSIGLTKNKTWALNLPLSYYRQFDYKYVLARGQAADIVVWHNEADEIPSAIYFETDYFNRFNCTMAVNKSLYNSKNISLEARVKKN